MHWKYRSDMFAEKGDDKNEVSEIEQMNISGGSSKGKETYWKNVYDVLLNLFGMK